MRITWDTNVNAPCVGKIMADDGQTLLIQTDWDYPGVASTFGWSTRSTQVNRNTVDDPICTHNGTDGTVDCPECGCTVSDFIEDARNYLEDNDGVSVEDPGYFTE